jgi:hypothetical protein
LQLWRAWASTILEVGKLVQLWWVDFGIHKNLDDMLIDACKKMLNTTFCPLGRCLTIQHGELPTPFYHHDVLKGSTIPNTHLPIRAQLPNVWLLLAINTWSNIYVLRVLKSSKLHFNLVYENLGKWSICILLVVDLQRTLI